MTADSQHIGDAETTGVRGLGRALKWHFASYKYRRRIYEPTVAMLDTQDSATIIPSNPGRSLVGPILAHA
jgi:hypothetical protein